MPLPVSVGEPFQRGSSWYYAVTVGSEVVERGPFRSRTVAARSCTRKRNGAARSERARAVAASAEIPPWDGTLGWWQRLIGLLAQQVAAGGDSEARHNLRAVADAGRTARVLWDQSEIERDVEQLQRDLDVLRRSERHGLGAAGSSQGPAEQA